MKSIKYLLLSVVLLASACRKDAPEFKSNEEVARWLDGKIIAAPKGSASDQYPLAGFRDLLARHEQHLCFLGHRPHGLGQNP
jgi:hypothetical protein